MSKPSVAVVYHFFPHYREAIMRELMNSDRFHYLFVGDVRDPANSGIKAAFVPPSAFIRTKSRLFKRRYLIQSGLIRLALRRDISAIIYLGDVQFVSTWVSAALARLTGKRVLFWTHGWVHAESPMRSRIRGCFYALAEGLLLYGHRARLIGIQKGLHPEHLYVVYNSLDYQRQTRIRQRITPQCLRETRAGLFAGPDQPMLICTGRLIKARRLHLLLQALTLLRGEGHQPNLLLVGDGPEREALQAYADENELAVRFYGACYDEETLGRLISAANATVVPGPIGLATIHSLVYGTPVITHNDPEAQMPEAEAIIPGINGDFFRRGDVADLAQVVTRWITPKSVKGQRRCHYVVDQFYNPEVQRRVIEQAIAGEPAVEDGWHEITSPASHVWQSIR